MRLTPGARLGPYEVLSVLGTGGMAEVYRARDTRLGREVALKVVNEALAGDPELVRRFEQEARLAGSLNHPNLVAVHDVGFHEGAPYFITELLQGESLRQRLARGRIPLHSALEWGAQLARGLAAAHGRGIVHRDVKPENIFVTSDGHVKLLDFGIAKLAEGVRDRGPHGLMDVTVTPTGSATRTGSVLGTPGYMSPEQVRGEPVDARTDIFSLGAVVYEMLAGKRAFPGASVVESGYAILHNEPEPLPPEVPTVLAQVVLHCLEKEPARRLQSASDLAFNLELLGTSSQASAPLVPSVGDRGARSRRWTLPALWAVGTIALVLGGVLIARGTRGPTNPSVIQITHERGTVSGARFAPDGRVIYSAAWDGKPEELYSRQDEREAPHPLSLQGARLLSVSSSGELAVLLKISGQWIGTLAILQQAGGLPREVAESVTDADWSPSRDLAVVRRIASGAYQLEYPLGNVVLTSPKSLHSPRVHPRGDRVAILDTSDWRIRIVDRHGQVQARGEGFGIYWGGLAWSPDGEDVWHAEGNEIYAYAPSGNRRLVYRGLFEYRLDDVSRDGRALVFAQNRRVEVAVVSNPEKREQLLTQFTDSQLASISDDGKRVLFAAFPGNEAVSYLRSIDDPVPIKLGLGRPLDLSADGKWVLAWPSNLRTSELLVFPTGPGGFRSFSVPGLDVLDARWFHDQKRVALLALTKEGPQPRLLMISGASESATVISNEDVSFRPLEVSPDDRWIAAVSSDGVLTLFPVGGREPIRLPEAGAASPVRWANDDQLWMGEPVTLLRSRLVLFNVRTRRIIEERMVAPADLTGVTHMGRIRSTADGRSIAFNYIRSPGALFVLGGLRPEGR